MENIIRTDYDLQQGDRYRQLPKGDSSPTDPKWIAYDEQLKAKKREEARKGNTNQASAAVAQPQPRESFGHRRTNCGMPFRVVVEWLGKLSKKFFLFPLALEEKKLYHSIRNCGSCDRLTAPTVSKY